MGGAMRRFAYLFTVHADAWEQVCAELKGFAPAPPAGQRSRVRERSSGVQSGPRGFRSSRDGAVRRQQAALAKLQVFLQPPRGQRSVSLDDRLGNGEVVIVTVGHPAGVELEDLGNDPVDLVAELAHHPEDLPVAQELTEQ